MFLQQRSYQLMSGKGGVWHEHEGVTLQMIHCRKMHPPHPFLLHDMAPPIQKLRELPALWDHFIAESKYPCLLFTSFWRLNKQLCVQGSSRVFICFIVRTFSLTLHMVFYHCVLMDSFTVSGSLSIKITAMRKEQLSYRAALSSHLSIATGQMSLL